VWRISWRGWSAEIVRQYPYLTLAETHAALTCTDHREEIEVELVTDAGR
jgi:uncharacterized protein (DUF433 family)